MLNEEIFASNTWIREREDRRVLLTSRREMRGGRWCVAFVCIDGDMHHTFCECDGKFGWGEFVVVAVRAKPAKELYQPLQEG